MFDVPILIITYNRVAFTHDLFTEIRKIRPQKLYVAADGAVTGDRNDYQHCLETRCVFMPEWSCNLHTFFSETHLGKAGIVAQAVSWFFSQEEEGIILFDDTLPHPDFFPFCKEMLEHFRHDKRVVHIGGTNMLRKPEKFVRDSYYFSAYPTTWAFATWKDRWDGFDLKMKQLEDVDMSAMIAKYTFKTKAVNFWNRRHNLLLKENIDIWEYPYIFHLWQSNGLSIVPAVNLVQNRGFRPQKRRLRKLNRPLQALLPIKHPEVIAQNVKADRYVFRRYYRKDKLTFLQRWLSENIFND